MAKHKHTYVGFKALAKQLGHKPGVTNPNAVAAAIAYKKYGKKAVQAHAKSGTSMRNVKPKK